jgi:hypothetical protein
MNPIWLQASALMLLSAFLLVRQWERTKEARRADAQRRAVCGKAFEAAPLLTQMKATRDEHFKLARQQRRSSDAHREFAARVGESLRRLAFFTRRETSSAESMTAEHPAESI